MLPEAKRGQPIGVVHESCVRRLEQGEDPRAAADDFARRFEAARRRQV